ncbi:hypothetical protein GCM10010329_01530 [Streptomyces spiroverticillatus]|uniref:DUF11 domain-containing protein n=1 Tax=Streptomyces finlayi TaxID=67296 RepID=A0A918WSJ2_9ACTN|nr:DUF11 domain-containing protein [Streptomyces finlayi]GGZ85606.1 hypothetical protein GCM10010329_01530 [Streptomyces spiroverticillatus]GHC77229.1 hypothetical protein GCM10010334_01520 [Streptomyces finlayi]
MTHVSGRRRQALLLSSMLVATPLLSLSSVLPAAAQARALADCTPSAGFTNCVRFEHTGDDQTFTVPTGVTSLDVRMWGAGGGGADPSYFAGSLAGAGGGFTQGTLAVSPGTALTVTAGGGGEASSTIAPYGGGGEGGSTATPQAMGGAGGGMSALWAGAYGSTPLLIAGGGGGASPGSDPAPYGGPGGGESGGQDGDGTKSGRGGTQSAGGAAAAGGVGIPCTIAAKPGERFKGGNGADIAGDGEGGGGGGGGYFGGGGGACQMTGGGTPNGGGGGGSGFIGGTGVSGAVTEAGTPSTVHGAGGAAARAGDDQYVAGKGSGGGAGDGGDGLVVLQWAAPKSALAVTKSVAPAPYLPGKPLTYTVKVTNSGPGAANGARVKDELPAALKDFTWTCAPTGGGVCSTQSGTGNIDATVDLPPGAEAVFTVTGTVPQGTTGTLDNTATVTAAGQDANCGPTCTSGAKADAETRADLAIRKETVTSGGKAVKPGQTFGYRITVDNRGPASAPDVKVTDPLPAALSFASSPDGCTAAGQDVTCGPKGPLANGDSLTWTFQVKLAGGYKGTGADIDNRATVTSAAPDPDLGNNTSASGAAVVKVIHPVGPVKPVKPVKPTKPTGHGKKPGHGHKPGHGEPRNHPMPQLATTGTESGHMWAAGGFGLIFLGGLSMYAARQIPRD